LDKFSDFCREYQGKPSPEEIVEVLRDYADKLDGLC